MVWVRLTESIEQRLTKAAKSAGKTKVARAREAILTYLEGLEDVHDADRVWQRIRSGKEKDRPFGSRYEALWTKPAARAMTPQCGAEGGVLGMMRD